MLKYIEMKPPHPFRLLIQSNF